VQPRLAVVLAAVAGVLLVALPLGGGASAATSIGANGTIAYAVGGSIDQIVSGSPSLVTTGVDPSWSPDGTKLAFAADSSGTGAIETCTVSACAPAQVGSATGTKPVWAPNGATIAFVRAGSIYTIPSGGSGTGTLVVAGTNPSFNPSDSTQLAYESGGQIFTCTIPGCASPTSQVSGSDPAWSPDGTQIAYVNVSGGISVYTIGGSSNQIVAPTTTPLAPNWSPEGDSIVFADSGGIESVASSGGSLTNVAASGVTPDWQSLVPVTGAAPSILGLAQTGQLLTATNGSWIGADPTHFPYTYQWLRCDSSGNNCTTTVGTASTYSPSAGDVGLRLRLVVTGKNAAGSTASAQSNATAIVTTGALTAPANVSYPVISLPFTNTSGVPNLGDVLSVSNGTWTGSFPMTFTYQWKKCDSPTGPCFNIVGATHSTFTVTTDLYGMSIRAAVTASNSVASVAQNSEATKLVSAIPVKLRSTPQILGTVQVGQTLSLTSGTWDGSTPITYTYSWRRCDPVGTLTSCVQIPGATSATYIPVVADIGAALRVWITGTNPAGSDQAVTNHTFPVIDKAHFAPSTADTPLITGVLEVGGLLTASIPTFSGDTPIATSQQWQRCDATGGACKNIAKATKATYVPVQGDIGSTLRLVVNASNAYGKTQSLSQNTEPVIAQLPHIKGKTIKGNSKSNYLIGTEHDDTIYGYGGNDTINGNGGYDVIYGGDGNDVINVSGPGRSKVYGGNGSDTIYAANNEKDTIDCGPGQDRAVIDPLDVVHNCEVVEVGGSSGSGSGSNSVNHRTSSKPKTRGKSVSPLPSDARTRRAVAPARSRAR